MAGLGFKLTTPLLQSIEDRKLIRLATYGISWAGNFFLSVKRGLTVTLRCFSDVLDIMTFTGINTEGYYSLRLQIYQPPE